MSLLRTVIIALACGEAAHGQVGVFQFSCLPATGPKEVGVAYSTTCTASGGTTPYTFTTTALPAGLAPTTTTNSITVRGAPTTAGAYDFTITGSDSRTPPSSIPNRFIGSISTAPSVTGPASLPPGTVGVPYGPITFTATGGSGGYSWSASELPSGLSISSGGALSGTPATGTQGTYSVSFTVVDSNGGSATVPRSLTINPALRITAPTSLSNATENVAYGPVTFTATGGTGGYTWSATNLPTGLSMSASGVLSGTPAGGTSGNYNPGFTVRDSSSATASVSLPLTVNPALRITGPTSLSNATENVAYGPVTFTASGGTGGYTWSGTNLPPGLSMSTTGVLSGTPAAGTSGNYNPGFTVRDSSSATASVSLPLIITPPTLRITAPTSLSAATVGVAYGPVTFTASGGTGGYTWSATGLPTGLNLSAGGSLNGTPASGTNANYTPQFTVKDSSNATASVQLPLTVNPPTLIITAPTSLPAATVGVAYGPVAFTATGGTGGYTWSCTGLPPGLVISPGGALSGTPAPGSARPYSVVCTVTDSSGKSASVTLTLTVNPPTLAITAPTSLSPATVAVAYGPVTFTASGGTGGYTWSATGLPPGLSFSAGGSLNGTPALGTAGNYNPQFTVKDSSNTTASVNLTLIVASPTPAITAPTSLSPATVGVPYGPVNFTASGGTGGYTWSATGLPPGLSFSAGGSLNGTPAPGTAGNYNPQFTVKDSNNTTVPVNLTLIVNPPGLAITAPTSLSAATVGVAYGLVTFTASGGTGGYTWSATGLPPGLSFSAGGSLNGTPAAGTNGNYNPTFTVKDSSNTTAPVTLPLVVNPPGLAITAPTSLSTATVGVAYGPVTFTATGGTGGYTWACTGLPPGLAISSGGALSGTPAPGSAGPYSVVCAVTDSSSKTASVPLALTVLPPTLNITAPVSLSPATVGVAYGPVTFTASGGTGGNTWSATGLPQGLSLSADGALSGTPAPGTQGNPSIQVTVKDSSGNTANRVYVLTINTSTLSATCTSFDGAIQIGAQYSVTCTATGGVPAYAWSTGGSLPPGVSLSGATGATVTISGILTTAGTYSFSVRVTDNSAPPQTASVAFNIVVPSGTTISCSPTAGPTQAGTAYSATCTATGGAAPYTWSVNSGSLPTGITLSATTGSSINIAGTPTTAGNYSYTVRATDSSTPPQSATQTFTGVIQLSVLSVNCVPAAGPSQPGVSFSAACTVTGGTAPYNWSIGAGALPSGLTLTSLSGNTTTISGIPASSGPYAFAVKAVDSSSPAQAASQNYTGTLGSRISLACSPTQGPTTLGVAYSATCSVSGGAAPYSWTASGLPAGLSLSGTSGNIVQVTGTPTAGGAYNFTIRVADSTAPSPQTASQSYTGSIGATLTMSCTPATGPVSGVPYSTNCTASGGTPPYAWAISAGALPAGLSLATRNDGGATVSGTSTATGPYSFTVSVTDRTLPGSQAASQTFSGVGLGSFPDITCTPATGPTQTGVSYSTTCAVTGGTPPYTFSIGSGSLPAGLSLNTATGSVSGTPTAAGPFSFTIRVTDSQASPQSASQAFSGTISSPLSVSPLALTFAFEPGGTVPSKPISVTSSGAALSFTASVTGDCPWLKLSPAGGTTPGSISVTADPAGLKPGSYNCTISIATPGATQNVFTSFNISGPALRTTPSSLTFNSLAGSAAPQPQSLSVAATNGAAINVSATAACPWVTLTPASGATPLNISVSVNTDGFTTPGTFPCSISINAPDASNTPQVPLSLVVSAATLTAPDAVALTAVQGTTSPAVRQIPVTGPSAAASFTATPATTSGGSWLTVTAPQTSTPANVGVQADPTGLAAGTYNGTVAFNSSSGQKTVAISFTVSPLPLLTLAPNSLFFHFQAGATPAPQVLSVLTSNNSPVIFNYQSAGPITVTTGPGPRNLTVAVNAGLQPGTYSNASVTIDTAGGSTSPTHQVASVTIVVDPLPAAPVPSVSPASLTFAYTQGAAAASQLLAVSNLGAGNLTIQARASTTSGGGWLSVTPTSASLTSASPVFLSVATDPSLIVTGPGTAGTYSGEILVVSGGGSQTLHIPVTMTVTPLPTVLLSRASVSFTVVDGGPAAPPEVIDVLPASLTWTAEASVLGPGSWLLVAKTSPTTAAISVNPAASPRLSPGTYYGAITIKAQDSASNRTAANSPLTVSVLLNVLPGASFPSPTVRPAGLTFSGVAGAANVPSQTVTVFNLTDRPVSYTSTAVTDDGAAWCTVSPANSPAAGITSASFPVTIQADYSRLTEGVRKCSVRLQFGDGSLQTVSVAAVVTSTQTAAPEKTSSTPAPRLSRSPGPGAGTVCNTVFPVLRQPGQGFNLPASQATLIEVAIQDNCGNPVDGTAISISFSNNDTTLHPLRVDRGLYRASWTPTKVPQNVSQSVVSIAVVIQPVLPQVYTAGGSTVITGTVSLALRNLTQIASEGVVNSASYTQGGRVSPGGWVAIFGDHLAEQQSIADSVPFANQLGGTRVLFGGESLPLLYVNSTQINAQVPYGLVPDTQHQLQVVFKQDQSEPVDVTVAQTQPAIFTTNQAGYGQGAIFWTNPANSYVLADTANPVPAGAVLEIYATGLGPVTRNVASGTVSPGDPPAEVQQTVSATIGGLPADIKFKGLTPGSVGLYQINTVVPTGIPPGSAVPIVISVGGQVSQPGVTIAVRN